MGAEKRPYVGMKSPRNPPLKLEKISPAVTWTLVSKPRIPAVPWILGNQIYATAVIVPLLISKIGIGDLFRTMSAQQLLSAERDRSPSGQTRQDQLIAERF